VTHVSNDFALGSDFSILPVVPLATVLHSIGSSEVQCSRFHRHTDAG